MLLTVFLLVRRKCAAAHKGTIQQTENDQWRYHSHNGCRHHFSPVDGISRGDNVFQPHLHYLIHIIPDDYARPQILIPDIDKLNESKSAVSEPISKMRKRPGTRQERPLSAKQHESRRGPVFVGICRQKAGIRQSAGFREATVSWTGVIPQSGVIFVSSTYAPFTPDNEHASPYRRIEKTRQVLPGASG